MEVLTKPPNIDGVDSHHVELDDVLPNSTHDPKNISDGESDNCVDNPENTSESQDATEVLEHNHIPVPTAQGAGEPQTSSAIERHHMMTRLKEKNYPTPHTALVGIVEPANVDQALKVPHWYATMKEEIDALHKNQIWTLVPKTTKMNVVGSRWVFKTKLKSDGSIDRHKARLVAKGYSQLEGIDFKENFSHVVKATIIRVVLSVVVSLKWPIRQLDVKNVFLHGHLQEEVYMAQPPGFVDPQYPRHACSLKKALYGLKQAPRSWFERWHSRTPSTDRRWTHGPSCSSCPWIESPKAQLQSRTTVDQHGPSFEPRSVGLTVDQRKLEARREKKVKNPSSRTQQGSISSSPEIERFLRGIRHQVQVLSIQITLRSIPDLQFSRISDDILIAGSSHVHIQEIIVALGKELAMTDLGPLQFFLGIEVTYVDAVNLTSQFMQNPNSEHFHVVKRILRYVRRTVQLGLRLIAKSPLRLCRYSDADWGGCCTTRQSTTGYTIYLGANCISWSSKKQHTVSRSSAEAEYRALASTAVEITWITYILKDIGATLTTTPILFCDNFSALYMTVNPALHARIKHVEMDYHFVR
ncbi:hypothetical protein MTR67_018923 [Solanum verrucosum]|uniref:Reverse transcriptase Ty1/copia-type domain-containing protein n=1 Tax=Solanum verrucosum TaxID=315347 RepID=A0AAF0TU79_SOLVR|nr:hypothetical protein MTR67_018923 [Solanum verrucosum]